MGNETSGTARFGTLLVLTVALLVYGSTYPWDFADRHYADGPVWRLVHSWPAGWNRWMFRDVSLNLILYLPVGVFAYLKLARSLGPAASGTLAILGGAALSACMEMVQAYEVSRSSSGVDLVCNIAGTGAGVALAHMYRTTLARCGAARIATGGEAQSALVLLWLWTGYQLAPLFPALSTQRLLGGIRSLIEPGSFSLSEFLAGSCEWLVVARLAQALSHGRTRPRFAGNVLAMLMLLVPARLLIAGRTATSGELLAVAAAWILWTVWLSQRTYRTRFVAVLALAAVAVRSLAPLDFSSAPQPFSWIPFSGSLSYDFLPAAIPLLRKAAIYGAALWLLNVAGVKRLPAAVGVAAMLAAIEAAQRYLPGHTPEITDPLVALGLAGVLRMLDSGSEKTGDADYQSAAG